MLLHDGKAYQRWVPDSEARFEELVNEHVPEVFGQSSEYFDIKRKVSDDGIASIPDGYLITFEGNQAQWYIVEVELSSHPVYEHVVTQASKFRTALQSLENRKKLAGILYDEVNGDPPRKDRPRDKLGDEEVYHFLDDLLSKDPSLLIVIDSETKELEAAVNTLRLDTDIVVFQTFVHGSLADHIHEFTPLYSAETVSPGQVTEADYSVVETGKVTVTLGGRQVRITRDDIMKVARDPRIRDFFYVSYHVDLDGRKLPVKGLLSLATGIPVTEFGSTPKARGILQKLGFSVVSQATTRIGEPHLKQSGFEREILLLLKDAEKPLRRKEIVESLHERMREDFSDADKARIPSGGLRWEKNALWAVTNLKSAGLIEAVEKNQYVITPLGHEALITKYKAILPRGT